MIPDYLKDRWESEQEAGGAAVSGRQRLAAAQVLCRAPSMDEADRRRMALRVMRFRVQEEYEMPADLLKPSTPDNLEHWVRLTNGVAVNLADGFVSRSKEAAVWVRYIPEFILRDPRPGCGMTTP